MKWNFVQQDFIDYCKIISEYNKNTPHNKDVYLLGLNNRCFHISKLKDNNET